MQLPPAVPDAQFPEILFVCLEIVECEAFSFGGHRPLLQPGNLPDERKSEGRGCPDAKRSAFPLALRTVPSGASNANRSTDEPRCLAGKRSKK
jgi:hypothetical protein